LPLSINFNKRAYLPAANLDTVPGYYARHGYSLAAGVGTINAQYFVPELARLG